MQGAKADVYGLGKVLYEAATGLDRQEFPKLPSLLSEEETVEFMRLNAVIVQACETFPTDRYQSAAELRGYLLDLKRHLNA